MILAPLWTSLLSVPLLFLLYIWLNDKKLKQLPLEAARFSPQRWSEEFMEETYERVKGTSESLIEELPPKTGRRYIVVGGAGFLGGWIVLHLLRRGEDPRRIRVLDIRPPQRQDLKEGAALDVDFIQVDISNAKAVEDAFQKPWPQPNSTSEVQSQPNEPEPEITVFHTAATIRFYERHPDLLPLSEKVNLAGTQNVVNSSRRLGVSTFVYTSSGSVAVRRSRFWLWPWRKEPKYFVQAINDDDSILPQRHDQFFSNYAVSKMNAERFVRSADRSPSGEGGGVLRTGCIRPGNGIYGPGGDLLVARLLVKKVNPTWIPTIMQSFVYVENCSLAHLCYEQRLVGLQTKDANPHPDIGGQAFCVADAGPTPTYHDVYTAVNTLSRGQASFIYLSPTLMLAISHLIEWYYLGRHLLVSSTIPFLSFLGHRILPPLVGEVIFLQPSMFALTLVHLIFDDSRARAPPEKGGLGYNGMVTTLEGVCKVVLEHQRGDGKVTERAFGGLAEPEPGSGFNLSGSEKGVGEIVEIVEKISSGLGVDATKVWN